MTPEEMRERSGQKVKQIMDLAKVLHLRVEARQRIGPGNFLENIVFWADDEKYPQAKVAGPTAEAEATPEAAPEVAPDVPQAPEKDAEVVPDADQVAPGAEDVIPQEPGVAPDENA